MKSFRFIIIKSEELEASNRRSEAIISLEFMA